MGGLFSAPKEPSSANSSGKPSDTTSMGSPFATCLPRWWSNCFLSLTPSRATAESSEDSAHGSVLTPRVAESASSGSLKITSSGSLKIISSSPNRRGKQLPTLKEVEDGSVPQYTAKEMKAATSNYKLVLGRGGFGTVYKGTMGDPRTGQPVEVAIKVLETSSSLGPEQFMTEVRTMAKLQHHHVLRLLGCCNDSERALVYEFIELGDVQAYLRKARTGEVEFPLDARMRIMKECADALAEIHDKGFIHRDFKPANVLLKEGLVPVVADFGIAHTIDDFVSHMTTQVIGSRAYIDPIYLEYGHLSSSCDVYAFGIFMLELLSGILATTDEFMPIRMYIVAPENKTVQHMKDEDLLDPGLRGKLTQDELIEFVRLIRQTQRDQWKQRPTMDDIFEMLSVYVEARGFDRAPVQRSIPHMTNGDEDHGGVVL